MKYLRHGFKLSTSDRHLLIQSFILLSFVRIGLGILPFKTLRKLLIRISHSDLEETSQNLTHTPNKIIWAVNLVSRYMPGVKCLAKALTTQVIMSQNGYLSQLKIGVVKGKKGQLEAHAWVEYQGIIVMGDLSDLERYTPLASL